MKSGQATSILMLLTVSCLHNFCKCTGEREISLLHDDGIMFHQQGV